MTTISDAASIDVSATEIQVPNASFWTRLIDQVNDIFERAWGFMNEDLGVVEGGDGDYPAGGCCCA